MRIGLAFLLAPWATPLTFMTQESARHRVVFFVFGLVAYFVTLVFGMPAFLIYRYFRIRNVLWFAFGGAAIGLIFPSLIFASNRTSELLLCAAAGGLSALTFRLLLPRDFVTGKIG
jgi:hypothetical protein